MKIIALLSGLTLFIAALVRWITKVPPDKKALRSERIAQVVAMVLGVLLASYPIANFFFEAENDKSLRQSWMEDWKSYKKQRAEELSAKNAKPLSARTEIEADSFDPSERPECHLLAICPPNMGALPKLYEIGTDVDLVRLRSGPGLDYDQIFNMQKGSSVSALYELNGWVLIDMSLYDEPRFGWALKELTKRNRDIVALDREQKIVRPNFTVSSLKKGFPSAEFTPINTVWLRQDQILEVNDEKTVGVWVRLEADNDIIERKALFCLAIITGGERQGEPIIISDATDTNNNDFEIVESQSRSWLDAHMLAFELADTSLNKNESIAVGCALKK